MGSIVRSIIGVVVGIVVANVVITILHLGGQIIFPLPEGFDPHNYESLQAAVEKFHAGHFANVLIAWLLGTFCGAFLAAWIARRAILLHAGIVGALFLLAGIVNMIIIPSPIWFYFAGVAVFPLGVWAGVLLAKRIAGPSRSVVEAQV